VDFSKITRVLPNFRPQWNLKKGIKELYDAYRTFGLIEEDLYSSKYFRVRWIKQLLGNNLLDTQLRFIN
jgi:hypothetical protein